MTLDVKQKSILPSRYLLSIYTAVPIVVILGIAKFVILLSAWYPLL